MVYLKHKLGNGAKLTRCLYELRAAKAANDGDYELAVILYEKALQYHNGNKTNEGIKRLIEKYKANLKQCGG